MLEKTRKYEEKACCSVPREQRPKYHFSVPIGWMNDPNGFSMYKGEIHLFFQYYPYERVWNRMHWGHTKTKDFVKWEYLPAALAPDKEYDSFGVFSGSALEEDGKQVLMYTGVVEDFKEDGVKEIRQHQCIAIGDGMNYEKLQENPVIKARQLPEGSSLEDFRDPKIWKEDGVFYVVVGSRSSDGSGQIALFSSKSLQEWKFCSILDKSENRFGKMWECPDFFKVDEKQILLLSPQDMEAKGLEFHNGNNAAFLFGSYDKDTYAFTREGVQSADYGLDYYAPQTMETMDGRRILIAWMRSWETQLAPENFKWDSMMTFPREVRFIHGRVIQNPVKELEEYRGHKTEYHRVTFKGEKQFSDIKGRTIDMIVEVEAGSFETFKISLAADGVYHTDIIYNKKENIVTFDRTYSGLRRDIVNTRSMYAEERQGKIKLRILADKYSVEIFVNDGQQVMTSLIYTPQEAENIFFAADDDICVSLTKYDIVI